VDARAVPRRRFAYQRECDGADTIIRNLLGAMSVHIRDGNPGEAVFMQTIVLALVHHALPAPWTKAEFAASRGGLSRYQLTMAIDMIEAQLLGRPSLVELASALNVSTRYFCRAFRRSTGLSPHQFIIRRRVSLARAHRRKRPVPSRSRLRNGLRSPQPDDRHLPTTSRHSTVAFSQQAVKTGLITETSSSHFNKPVPDLESALPYA